MFDLSANLDHNGRFRNRLLLFVTLFIDHAEANDRKKLLVGTQSTLHQEFKGSLCTFKLVATVFHLLDVVEDLQRYWILAVEVEVELFRLGKNIGTPREIGNQDAGRVADDFGANMLIGLGMPLNRADVNATLMRKG